MASSNAAFSKPGDPTLQLMEEKVISCLEVQRCHFKLPLCLHQIINIY
jgi:hypothetical protein